MGFCGDRACGYLKLLKESGVAMAEEERFEMLDLSKLNVRARIVLRRLGVDTVEKLLSVTENELSAIKGCGAKTVAKIVRLQEEYGKEPSIAKGQQETLDITIKNGREFISRLIVVAIVAKELIEGAKKDKHNRYYFRVTTKRFNMLTEALEALRETGFLHSKE